MSEPGSDIATKLLDELGWVRRLARKLVGDGAEDLTQDVAILALEQDPRPAGLRSWLGAVTRRRAARWHRSRRRRNEVERSHAPQRPGDDPADVVARLQQQRELAQAVLELPEPYRSVIVARFLDELSPKEIARRRDASTATVRQQVHRGVEMLRVRLRQKLGPDWRAGIAGLVLPRTVTTAIAVGGGVIMTKKLMLAAGGIAVALLVVLWGLDPATDRPLQGSTADAGPMVSSPREAKVPPATTMADRAPVARPDLPRFLLEVVTDQGDPIAGAEVFLHGRRAIQLLRTDAKGQVSDEPDSSPGGVLVLPGNRPPVYRELPSISGHTRVELPKGASVAGHAQVFDRPLPGPIRLELTFPGSTRFLDADLPVELLVELQKRRFDVTKFNDEKLTTLTDAAGAFAFHGLPETWSGRLALPLYEPYFLRPDESSLEILSTRRAVVSHVSEDIVLSLTRVPAVRGRVVWRDGSVAAGASIRLQAFFEDGEESPSMGRPVEHDGTFEMGLETGRSVDYEAWLDPDNHQEVVRVHISWKHPDAMAEPTREVSASELHNLDLGDLILDPASALHVLVHDSDGAPVPGVQLSGRKMQSPTDRRGRGILLVEDPGRRTFLIGAPGYLVDEYTAEAGTGTETDPLRFTVQPGNQLTVRVRPSVFDLEELRLEIAGSGPAFTGGSKRIWPSTMHVAAGSTEFRSGTYRSDGSGNAAYALKSDGEVVFSSVLPGVSMTFRVVDEIHHVLTERTARLPDIGSRETLEIRTDAPVSDVAGTVILEGHPLSGASVMFRGENRGVGRTTDENGNVTIRLLATNQRIEIEVDHPDAPVLHTELVLASGPLRPVFTLERAQQLEVHVVDELGAPVGARFSFEDSRIDGDRSDLRRGHVSFRRLPAGSRKLLATVSGRTFERTVDPATQSSVEFRVPVLARVRLRLPPVLPHDRLVLELEDIDNPKHRFRQDLRLVAGLWTPNDLSLFPGTYRVTCTPRGDRDAPPWTTEWTVRAGEDLEKTVLR